MTEYGAPWNISTGGPAPPMTALISAPEVLIRSLRQPAGKKFMHGAGVPDAGVHTASSARAFDCKNAAAPAASAVFVNNSRRVSFFSCMQVSLQSFQLKGPRAIAQLFDGHSGSIENRHQKIRHGRVHLV